MMLDEFGDALEPLKERTDSLDSWHRPGVIADDDNLSVWQASGILAWQFCPSDFWVNHLDVKFELDCFQHMSGSSTFFEIEHSPFLEKGFLGTLEVIVLIHSSRQPHVTLTLTLTHAYRSIFVDLN